jgi:hypothetical protein
MSVYSLLGDNLNTEDPRLFWTCLAFCVRRFSRLARDVLHRHAQDGRGGRTNKFLVAVDEVPFIIHKDNTDRRDLLHLCCDGAKLNSKVTHTVCVCVVCVSARVQVDELRYSDCYGPDNEGKRKEAPKPKRGKEKAAPKPHFLSSQKPRKGFQKPLFCQVNNRFCLFLIVFASPQKV